MTFLPLTLTGNNSNNTLNGGWADDKLYGLGGNDLLNGSYGNDALYGGSGNDTAYGGDGNDLLDGGSGSDRMYGGNGADTFIHRISENVGSADYYNGGGDADFLRFEVTRSEWLRADFQADIAGFISHIAAGGIYRDFKFTSTNLTVNDIGTVQVYVDGVSLNVADEAVKANADVGTVAEDKSITLAVLGNDLVPDLVKSVSIVSGVSKGTLTVNADNTITFNTAGAFNSLNAGQTAQQTFVYRVTDADGDTSDATVTLTVTGVGAPINAAPVLSGQPKSLAIEGNGNVTLDLLSGAVDPEGATLSIKSLSALPAGVTLQSDGRILVLDSNNAAYNDLAAGATRTLNLTYQVSDGINSVNQSASFVVTGTNDAPIVANPLADVTIKAGTQLNVVVPTTAFSDVDSSSLSFSASGLPAWLSFNALTRTFSGTPTGANVGDVNVTVTASDGSASASDVFLIHVTPPTNIPPILGISPRARVTEGGANFVLDLLSGALDPEGSPLSVINLAPLPSGMVLGADGRTVTIDASNPAYNDLAAGETRTIVLNYQVSDGTAAVNQTASVIVTGTNDAPTLANPLGDQTLEVGTLVDFVLPSDIFADVDTANLAISVTGLPSWLSFDAATRTFSGTPKGADVGFSTLQITASDGSASVSDAFVLTVKAAQNLAPVVSGALAANVVEGGANVALNLLTGSSDPEGAALQIKNLSVLPSGVSLAADGVTLNIDAQNASFNNLAAGAVRTLNLTYQVSDGVNDVNQTASITVTGTNDAPIISHAIADQAARAGSAFSFVLPADTFSDVDGNSLTLSATGLPSWLTFDATSRTFSGSPTSLNVGDVNVTVQASDGITSVSDVFVVSVTGAANAAPVVKASLAASATEGGAKVSLDLLSGATDPEGAPLSVANLSGLPAGLTLGVDGRTLTIDPKNPAFDSIALGATRVLNLSYQVSDGVNLVNQTAAVTIKGVNDRPILANALADKTVSAGGPVNFVLPANAFSDADGEALKLTTSSLPAWLKFNPLTATFSGTPGAGDVGVVNITVTASDNHGVASVASDVFALTIVAAPTNNAPEIGALSNLGVNEDQTISLSPGELADFLNVTDPDGDLVSVSLTFTYPTASGLSPQTVPVDLAGAFEYAPPLNFNGEIQVTVTANDGQGAANSIATQTFAINVAPVNDAPVIGPLTTVVINEDESISLPGADLKALFAVSDVDGDPLAISLTFTYPTASGLPALTLPVDVAGNFFYQPPLDFNGDVQVTVTVDDGAGAANSIVHQDFTLTLLPVIG
jgi:VCBS repeat-containing protein